MTSYSNETEEPLNYYKFDRQYDSLIIKRNISRHIIDINKNEAYKITRQIPLKLLALDWLNNITPSVETRAYLIENFLPILILGCEKLLKEAQNRNLIDSNHQKADVNFNPINYLAQYLLRNNPKYNNQNETSHYVRSMREVYQELRDQMFEIQGNKLAKQKEDIRKRRAERDKEEKLKQIEQNRRKTEFDRLFKRFYLAEYGRLEISIIKNALNIYKDNLRYLTDENFKNLAALKYDSYPSFCYSRDELNVSKRILRHEFVEVMQFLTDGLSSDAFDYFVEYFEQCSIYFIQLANSTNLNRILRFVFKLIDSTNSGFLSRRRLIKLFEEFKEKRKMCEFRNPLEWPVLDSYIKFENKLEERVVDLEELESKEKKKILEISVKSIAKAEEEVSMVSIVQDPMTSSENAIDKENNLNEETIPEAQVAPIVEENNSQEIKVSEQAVESTERLAEVDQSTLLEQNDAANLIDTSVIEPVGGLDLAKPGPAKAELVTTRSNTFNNSNIDDAVTMKGLKKTRMNKDDDLKRTPEKPFIKRDDELLFIKGGILYYVPLKEPLNAFDSALFVEKKNKNSKTNENQNEIHDARPLQNEFDTELVNERQFLNLVNNFVMSGFLNSEIYVNDLITFIKNNFAENQYEKLSKLKKADNIKRDQLKSDRYSSCFDKLDINSSGMLSLNFINNLMMNYKDGLFREQCEFAISEIKNEIKSNTGKDDDHINKQEFSDLLSIMLDQIETPKIHDQIINYLNGQPQIGKTRSEERKSWLEQIRYIGEITYGTFEPLYKQLFLTLLKDAENYGNGKTLSAYVGILERLEGKTVGLKYHATTPHDSKLLLGKTLTRKAKNISFGVIDKANYEHIPKVRANSSVHFFDQEGRKNGSLVIFPLKYTRNKIFGTLGIDTLNDFNESTFQDHEINFYQGIANTFAKSYANIIFKNRLIKTCSTAIEWLHKRCTGIESCNVYIVQVMNNELKVNSQSSLESSSQLQATASGSSIGLQKSFSLSLKPVLKYSFKSNGKLEETIKNDAKLMDEELPDIYGSKAYECARTSETTVDIFNQQICYYVPLRNEKHKTIFVMEIKSKDYNENSHKYDSELDQIETTLYILHKCQEELLDEHFASITRKKFSFETQYEHEKFEILFEKCYLNHVCQNLKSLIGQQVNELMPDGSLSPETSEMSQLIRLVTDLTGHDSFNQNKIIDEKLINLIQDFDPTIENFKFKSTTSKLNIEKEDYLNDLNKYYLSLTKSNTSLKLLTDWSYLIKQLKIKTDKVLATTNTKRN